MPERHLVGFRLGAVGIQKASELMFQCLNGIWSDSDIQKASEFVGQLYKFQCLNGIWSDSDEQAMARLAAWNRASFNA